MRPLYQRLRHTAPAAPGNSYAPTPEQDTRSNNNTDTNNTLTPITGSAPYLTPCTGYIIAHLDSANSDKPLT